MIDISRYLNRLQFGGTDRLPASLARADDAGGQQRIYSMRPVTVKQRYKNKTLPFRAIAAETVIWPFVYRDSYAAT